jgi:hypothetical protein
MKNKKENINFVELGLYRAEEADILKRELEKDGIPVKVLYPGKDSNLQRTEEIRKKI